MANVSRRDFVRSAGLFGAGAALAGAIGLTGCSQGEQGSEGGAYAAADVEKRYEAQVHEADVVIVGGGVAGATAARRVLEKGLSVSIVDKGPWGHSGTSGMNWGHNAETNEWAEGDGSNTIGTLAYMFEGMVNQPNCVAVCQSVHEGRPIATYEQAGCNFERTKEGHSYAQNAPVDLAVDNGCFNRYFCLELERKGADIHDRTMVIDLLQAADGSAAGVVAIDLVDGSAHVFRGKTVIFATGSYRWVSGFNGMKPHTIASPENTGDGLGILMRKGVAMRDMEAQPIDYVQWTPMGTRQSMGAMGGSTINFKYLFDKDKNKLIPDEVEGMTNGQLARAYVRAIMDGRATENDGIYVITNDPHSDDRYYRRTKENQARFLGYELPEYTEVVAEQWEDAGHPFVYTAEAETEIPGLYYAATAQGGWTGVGFFYAFGTGFLAGESAAAKAKAADKAPAVDWEAVNAALSEAYGLLEAEPADPIRSTVIFRSIQEAYWMGLGPARDEEGILASIAELKRIETEDLPKMQVPSKSKQYNSDWHRALEVKNMLMCAQATAEAALIRKECRGPHVRTDYPAQDNDNFLVSTKVSYADGAWSSSLEALDDSIIPMDTLKGLVPIMPL